MAIRLKIEPAEMYPPIGTSARRWIANKILEQLRGTGVGSCGLRS